MHDFVSTVHTVRRIAIAPWREMMSRLATLAFAALTATAAMLTAATQAGAADPVHNPITSSGTCSYSWVLRTIKHRFGHQVRHVPNLPDVAISDFFNINERRYLAADTDHPIARTYCRATVALSDGHSRSIHYLIEQGQGLAGIGDNVEFCVAGFDRWHVYDGACRILR